MIKNIDNKSRLIFLDCLRIFAFASVLVGHKFYDVLENLSKNEGVHLTLKVIIDVLKTACWGGGAGVIVFFLISGYVITLVLKTEDTQTFLLKRVFRIYPLYIFAVLLESFLGNLLNQSPYPPLSILVPRLLLVGDFFNTPYALSNVEWTLRIEVLFYAIMAVFKALGLMSRPKILILVYCITVILFQFFGPFPSHPGWSHGYVTLFLPFLFVGSCLYLMEIKDITRALALFCMSYIFISYLYLTPFLSPGGKDSHFVIFAFSLFLLVWLIRLNLKSYFLIVSFSELTYSVYLFHNWLWPYLGLLVENYSFIIGYQRLKVLFLLLVICYFLRLTIETFGIFLGKKISGFIQSKRDRTNLNVAK
jgi:peptidoglycan/LPS O-acetylase OafA/YrhL